LCQLLKFLSIERADMMGCSLGGRVIIDLALAYPAMVNSLISIGSGLGGYRFEGEDFTRYVEQIMAARKQEDDEREIELKLQFWVDGRARTPEQVAPLVRERARQMLVGRPGIRGEGRPLEPNAIGRLAEMDVPILIIVGDRDEANVAAIAEFLASNIRGAQKAIIPNTAHLPNMEEPDQFNHLVLGFLRSTPAQFPA
jgi:pimeloyl-ACP methyl ester carboxylesterase